MHLSEWEEQSGFTHLTHPPVRHSLGQDFLAHDLSNGEKGECVSEHPASPAVQDTTKEVCLLLTPFRILSHNLHD